MNRPDTRAEAWDQEAERFGPLLDPVHAVIVASADPHVAVQVALAVARQQGQRRRVAVADLLGESPAIEALLTGDDPHGIADSFLYGVSLNRIARPMRGSDTIFLLPSGTEPVDQEGVYANERWRRLAAGFEQVGALLVLVARPSARGFDELCRCIGAVLPVGEAPFTVPADVTRLMPSPAKPTGTAVAAPAVTAPVTTGTVATAPLVTATEVTTPVSSTRPTPSQTRPAAGVRGGARRPKVGTARVIGAEQVGSRRRTRVAIGFLIAAGLMASGVAVTAIWPQWRDRLPAPLARLVAAVAVIGDRGDATPARPSADTAADSPATPTAAALSDSLADSLADLTTAATGDSAGTPSPVMVSDSARTGTMAATGVARAGRPLAVENAGDSLAAARYAVYFATANTWAGAVPAPTTPPLEALALSPVLEGGDLWFRVTVGAYASRADAERLLGQLRSQQLIRGGNILAVPFALRLEQGVPTAGVSARLRSLRDRGVVAYALRQADGRATIYSGAFESPAQARVLADSLRGSGMAPALVYRTGRAF